MDIFKTPIFKTVCGDMLVDNAVVMTIRGVEVEDVTGPNGTIKKPVLYFEKSDKPLVLNVTNSKKLAKTLGRETNAWRGAKVKLFAESIKAFGEVQNAVRLTVTEKPPVLTQAEHKDRMKQNGAVMRPPIEDTPIGEDSPEDQDRARFAKRVIAEIPFYTSDAQIWFELMRLEFEYNADTEEICFDALARVASREADKAAA